MNNVQYLTAIIVLLTNVIILLTQAVQLYKLKKQLKDVKLVINTTADLQNALKKPLEGIWKVHGHFSKYHNVTSSYNVTGFAHFDWDDYNKRYDVHYAYSARKENECVDLVTAVCSGIATCNENGGITNNKQLSLHMAIDNRSTTDGFNNSSKTFNMELKKASQNDNKIHRMEFLFDNSNANGIIEFIR